METCWRAKPWLIGWPWHCLGNMQVELAGNLPHGHWREMLTRGYYASELIAKLPKELSISVTSHWTLQELDAKKVIHWRSCVCLTDHELPELQERSTPEPRREQPPPLAVSLQHFLLIKITLCPLAKEMYLQNTAPFTQSDEGWILSWEAINW